ncbi:MAG: hypothetical protein KBC33_03700 [Candidatus Pacebacteria bacterium]|nr:hypothetical protein [Candidatus Paceibacterota bacterium]
MIIADPTTGYRCVVGYPNELPSAFYQSEALKFAPPGPEDKKRHTQMDFLIELNTKLDKAEWRFENWRRQGSFYIRLTQGDRIPCMRPLHVQEQRRRHRIAAIREDDGPTEGTLRINRLLWWRTIPDLTIDELAQMDEIAANEVVRGDWN